MTKRLLLIGALVAAVAIGGTSAFFSDTETSTGNTFTAGAIDLKIDDHCWYNGLECKLTTETTPVYTYGGIVGGQSCSCTWDLTDFDPQNPKLFFSFADLKPGDWGEDTISLHVNNNDAWACAAINMTQDDDMDCTEPELTDDTTCLPTPADLVAYDGELADNIEMLWWADDGDNVFETDEQVTGQWVNGTIEFLMNDNLPWFGDGANDMLLTLSDTQSNFFDSAANDTPMTGAQNYYIGKAWCFGDLTLSPVTPGDNSPVNGAGFTCTGAGVINNASQTDSVKANISFMVEQSRNNADFLCPEHREVK